MGIRFLQSHRMTKVPFLIRDEHKIYLEGTK